jgi:hypothetical protein
MKPNSNGLPPRQVRQLQQMVRFVRLVLDQKFVGIELGNRREV